METFFTGTGRELQTDYIVPAGPYAYIRVFAKTWAECATIFSNPAETKKITSKGVELVGYTTLCSISAEGPAMKIQLAKEGFM